MRAKKKCLSRWYAVRIIAVALGCALMVACETQAPQTPTATPIPPTATGTPEATSTDTPVPTASNTPTPEAPQAISNFVDNLPGEFSLVWSSQTKSWDLNQHLTVQLTETENQTTDQTVARFNADGTQMTITVKGEDVQVPVTNFGQSADQSGAEDGSYQLIPGADVKTGIGFNLGIKDTVDGRVAYGYNVWGQWVKNEAYRVGNLEVNDFNLFAGALQINPDRADYIYQGLVGGIYNIQIVTGNQAILDQYPTPEAFLQAAQSSAEFTNLNIPQYYPQETDRNLYNRMATIDTIDQITLDTLKIGFAEQSRDRILHPTSSNRSSFSFSYDSYMGSVADMRVGTTESNGVSTLFFTLGRVKLINPFGCFSTMQIGTPQDQLIGSANQLLEMWIYTINSSRNPFSSYVAGLDYPLLNFYPSLHDLYQTNPDYACSWSESDFIQFNK